jgi:ribosomal protein L40E
MRFTRQVLFSILLLLSLIPLLSAPIVISQNVSTVTNTSYSYSVTSYVTSTSSLFVSIQFTVTAHCHYSYYPFNASGLKGTEIFGGVLTSSKMDFYIMTGNQYSDFTSAGGRTCQGIPASGLVVAKGVTSAYAIDWVVPPNEGTYYFIFANPYALDATVQFGLWKQAPVTELAYVTSLIVWTETRTATPTATQSSATPTLSSVYSSTLQTSPGLARPTTYIEYLAVIVVLGAIAVGAILISGKRARKPTAAKETSEAKTKKEVQFCINCGAELPRDSKFCNKCGSAQS